MKGMQGNELTISELAVIYEQEKKLKTLTRIRKDFYPAAIMCIQKLKERYLKELANNPDAKTTEMARRELERAKKDLENTVHLRSIKILKRSLEHYFKPDLELIDALTEEEKKFLDGIMAVITQFVANVWLWDKAYQQVAKPAQVPPTQKIPEKLESPKEREVCVPLPTMPAVSGHSGLMEEKKNIVVVLFTTEGSIATKERNLYFKNGDIAGLPEKLAKVLIKEKKASPIYPI
ncbi:MAG: hypothetical protein ACPL1Y_00400 [Thermoplasmata archaeon]